MPYHTLGTFLKVIDLNCLLLPVLSMLLYHNILGEPSSMDVVFLLLPQVRALMSSVVGSQA